MKLSCTDLRAGAEAQSSQCMNGSLNDTINAQSERLWANWGPSGQCPGNSTKQKNNTKLQNASRRTDDVAGGSSVVERFPLDGKSGTEATDGTELDWNSFKDRMFWC